MTTPPAALARAARCPGVQAYLPVFVELHGHLDTSEFRVIRAWYVAKQLKLDDASVYRAIQALHREGFLERGPRRGNSNTYRITLPLAESA